MSSLLTVKNLNFEIQGRQLLQDIEFSLASGELLVVIGRNGAGKSTLLKHLTAEQKSASAQITLFGQELRSHRVKDLARQRAVLAQNTPLNFDYKVLEVVMLGRIPHQKYQKETAEDFKISCECLATVGLTGYENRDYLTLSGGEQQRVHLARVLAQLTTLSPQPRLLFLDEPTSSLDISHQHQVLDVVRDLTRQNMGVFAILHDLNLAAQYADRILVLSEGRVLALGKPFEVLTSDILREAFHHEVLVTKHPHHDFPLVISTHANRTLESRKS
ncbi:MAG: heme ABC transporter ATP-binding protein [Bdellovibrio sp.]